jgi:signal peptidase
LSRRYLYWVLQAAAVLGWIVFLRPAALGGPASYVIVSGRSMEPTLLSGDFVFAFRQDDYGIGDLVAFRVPAGEPGEGAAVIHRIVGREAKGFITQGDNSGQPDTWRPTAQDILGRLRFSLPGGGRAVEWMRQPVVLGAIAGLLGMSFVLTGGKTAGRKARPEAKAYPLVEDASVHQWDRLLMKDLGPSGVDPARARSGFPQQSQAAGPLVARAERAISTKDLLRWSRMDRRAVLRHPLPSEAEVFVVRSGNRTHWVVAAKGRIVSDEPEEDKRA